MPSRLLARSICACLLSAAATHPLHAQIPLSDLRLGAFAGPAIHTGASSLPIQFGLSADATIFHPPNRNPSLGVLIEGGVFHPALSGTGNYYFSTDAILSRDPATRLHPFAAAGYTRMFNATTTTLTQANAVNLGIGADCALTEELSLRLEVREHYTPSTDTHALVFRIGLVGLLSTL